MIMYYYAQYLKANILSECRFHLNVLLILRGRGMVFSTSCKTNLYICTMIINKSNIRHIFFDLDNTLWDFKANSESTLMPLFNEFGLRTKFHDFIIFHHIYKHHNQKMWIAYNQGNISKEELIVKRFYYTLKEKGINDRVLAEDLGEAYLEVSACQTKLFPKTVETLNHLNSKGYACHIITNGFIRVQTKKIMNCGLSDIIETLTCSEEAGCSKPNKEIFELALSKAKAVIPESIMVGDDFNTDIRGARNINMQAIHVDNSPEWQNNGHPTIHSIADLCQIL